MNEVLEALNEMINKFVEILLEVECEKPTAVSISSLNNTLRLALHDKLDIIESALKRLDKIETTTHSVLREDISKKLKALEIIKSFNDYQIVEVQGQWYLMRGIEFGKSIKMPITKEQADLLKEVLL